MQPVSKLELVTRGATKACPRCSTGKLFTNWFVMAEDCPGCGHRFERDPGYWLGAMIINTAVVIGVFLVGFVGIAWLTWPDVPWTGILIGTITANLLIPLLFFPFSKTLFVALDLAVRPVTPGEAQAAEGRLGLSRAESR